MYVSCPHLLSKMKKMQPYQLFGIYLRRDQTEGTIPKTEIGMVWQTQKTLSAALGADISGYKRGGFKFQVQQVKDDAVAYRLPVASGSSDLFLGACVQAMRDGVQRARHVARQVRALGLVLAPQASRILVGAAWPGAVWLGTEDLDREPLDPRLVFGQFVPSIVRQGVPQHIRAGICRSVLVKPSRALAASVLSIRAKR
jgi:hypothetical protein